MKIEKRILLLTLAVFNIILLNAQGTVPTNSVWRDQVTTTAPISDTNSNIDNSQYEMRSISDDSIVRATTSKAVTGTYNFSGGSGTEADPFLISTPEDMVAFSDAINRKLQYNGSKYYYDAFYRMTNDINMGERVSGPFLICDETVNNMLVGNVHEAQLIQQATGTGNGPFTSNVVPDDTKGPTVTVNNKTETKTNTWSARAQFGSIISLNFTHTFNYKYYDAATLPLSAVTPPVGKFVSFYYQREDRVIESLTTSFRGTFDGGGYTISNFEVVATSDAAGLFGFLSNKKENPAIVKNLNMDNCNITSIANKNAGAIVGVLGYGKIINCSVTNSTICGQNAGGIAGSSSDGFKLWISNTTDGKSDGYVEGCYSANNEIIGGDVGGIIGSTVDSTDHLKDNTVSHNGLNGTNTGTIVGGDGHTPGDDGHFGDGNKDLADENGLSFVDYVKTMLEGKVPDFCYINFGIAFDPSIEKDATALENLRKQLDGTLPITQNLVLPDIAKLDELSSALSSGEKDQICEKMYEQHIELGNSYSDCAVHSLECMVSSNLYKRESDGTYSKVVGVRNGSEPYYYHVTGDKDVYYIMYTEYIDGGLEKALYTQKKYGESVTEADGFLYLYRGWDCYPDELKNIYRSEIDAEDIANVTGLGNLSRYYKLTAPGTPSNPIILLQEIGTNTSGGIFDKGGQLSGKIVEFRRTFPLEKWALLGIVKIEDMGNGWNNQPMDGKVNFLSNTEENNDFAAVEFDYTINNWRSAKASERPDTLYMHSTDNLAYGQGIFVWPYNTTHPLAQGGIWDFTTTTINSPILYQTGVVKAYSDSIALNAELSEYISGLVNTGAGNTSGVEVINSKWFALANPFLAEMDPVLAIDHLKGTGELQGDCLYKYKIDGFGNGQWARVITVPRAFAGDGFLAAIAEESGNSLQGTLSTRDLYGWDYVPLVSTPILDDKKMTNNPIKRQMPTHVVDRNIMTFSCYDKVNMGVCNNMTAKYTPEARNHFDRTDAYALLASSEKYSVEPFFVVNGENIWHNGFNRLPYDAPIGFNANVNGEVTLCMVGEPDSIDVYLMEAQTDVVIAKMNSDVVYVNGDTISKRGFPVLNLEQGYNLGKYKIRFCRKGSNVGITDVVQMPEADVTIWNNNREVTINGDNLKYVEVCNTLGQKVYTRELAGDTYKFDLKAISGAYIIRVKTDEGIKTQKIVIK